MRCNRAFCAHVHGNTRQPQPQRGTIPRACLRPKRFLGASLTAFFLRVSGSCLFPSILLRMHRAI